MVFLLFTPDPKSVFPRILGFALLSLEWVDCIVPRLTCLWYDFMGVDVDRYVLYPRYTESDGESSIHYEQVGSSDLLLIVLLHCSLFRLGSVRTNSVYHY